MGESSSDDGESSSWALALPLPLAVDVALALEVEVAWDLGFVEGLPLVEVDPLGAILGEKVKEGEEEEERKIIPTVT